MPKTTKSKGAKPSVSDNAAKVEKVATNAKVAAKKKSSAKPPKTLREMLALIDQIVSAIHRSMYGIEKRFEAKSTNATAQ